MDDDARLMVAAGYAFNVTAANWQFPPYSRWGFSNCRRVLPTARVDRSSAAPHLFSRGPRELKDLKVSAPGGEKSVEEILEECSTDGFVVLHQGRIVFERYFGELHPRQTHIVMSVSKSILSGLVGILVERGVLDVSRTAGHYVPELNRGGYGAVTLDRLLDMRSGVKYSEDYNDPNAEFFDFDAVCGLRPRERPHAASGMYEYLTMLTQDPADPGDFAYRSTDSDVLGWVAERSTGRALEQLLSVELWAPLGAEEDADLLVDPIGSPLADGGLCTTLRDLARFAQMQLEGGSFNGRQIVPERWIMECCSGDRAAYARNGHTALFPRGAYSRQWWVADVDRRIRLALGIHGQMIYLDPNTDLACVTLASAPNPVNPRNLAAMLRVCAVIGNALA